MRDVDVTFLTEVEAYEAWYERASGIWSFLLNSCRIVSERGVHPLRLRHDDTTQRRNRKGSGRGISSRYIRATGQFQLFGRKRAMIGSGRSFVYRFQN